MILRRRVSRITVWRFLSMLLPVVGAGAWLHHPTRHHNFVVPRRVILLKGRDSATTDDEFKSIKVLEGPWNSSHFGATGCWCRSPLLLKGAFPYTMEGSSPIPSWETILDLACCASSEEDQDMAEALSCRLIQHIPGRLDSFTIEFGPFESIDDMNEILLGNTHEKVSTLVVNDVDRWIPDLSDWMDEQFDFLPRWRRDDAQVSLAAQGGGIGPHVDNYDVFLIQSSGNREWEVGLQPISAEQEYTTLVEDSQVSILNMTQIQMKTVKVMLQPGDCLYLPPRFVHCGTSDTDDCVTLSVGCRAPSAADLLSRLAERVAQSSMPLAARRYVDEELFDSRSTLAGGLTKEVSTRMKDLLVDIVQGFVSDEEAWTDLVGKIVTDPNRPIIDYPTPLQDIDSEWKSHLGVWGNGVTALQAVVSGNGILRRAEGIAFAWSYSEDSMDGYLYIQGRSFRLKGNMLPAVVVQSLLERISNGPPITKLWLDSEEVTNGESMSPEVRDFLVELLDEGLIYGEESQQLGRS